MIDYIRDSPQLLLYFVSYIFSERFLPTIGLFYIALHFLLLFLYLLSPLDLIPEAVVGPLGYLDDFAAIFLSIVYWSVLFRRLLNQRR